MKKFLLVLIAFVLPGASLGFCVNAFISDFAEYEAEGVCIGKLIATHTERSNIQTLNGTCSQIKGTK